MPAKRFGEELRRLRRQEALSLADLADALGCSITLISDIERGKKNPPRASAIRILLARLGHEERFAEFLSLAIHDRQSIEISLKDKDEEVADMLGALARRCDEGELNQEVVKKIRKLLDEEQEK